MGHRGSDVLPVRQPLTATDYDWRTFGEKRRAGFAAKRFFENLTVEIGDIAIQFGVDRIAHAPARVFNLVFHGGTIGLARVAPIVLGDEFRLGAGDEFLRLAARRNLDAVLASAKTPRIFSRVRVNFVAYGQRDVILVVEF